MTRQITDRKDSLTELEAAILVEIHLRGNRTAFKVRKAFLDSPSVEWSGSAGAVYPAVRRLAAAGLVATERRGGKSRAETLSVTPEGQTMIVKWARDPVRAIGAGLDPFRLRAGVWGAVEAARDGDLIETLRAAIRDRCAMLTDYSRDLDPVDRLRVELEIELQRTRLRWLDRFEAAHAGDRGA
jgi:DNA-binding PadR family transcriptional regulator